MSSSDDSAFHESWVVENVGIRDILQEHDPRAVATGLNDWADWIDENTEE